MCGIFAILDEEAIDAVTLLQLKELNQCRGPDYSSTNETLVTKCGIKLKLAASVLHLRGDNLQEQPVIGENGNALLFNGIIYRYKDQELPDRISDTTYLFRELELCRTSNEIARVFGHIDGPFAFIYWHETSNSLFFGRDFFGRKSLCLGTQTKPFPLIISTLAPNNNPNINWSEVECTGIHSLEFCNQNEVKQQVVHLWNIDSIYPPSSKCDISQHLYTIRYVNSFKALFPLNNDLRLPKHLSDKDLLDATDGLLEKLTQAILRRIKYNRIDCLKCRRMHPSRANATCDHSKVAVAFSGGIDSVLLAFILDKVCNKTETIDLLTVAFKKKSPDRASVAEAFIELRALCPLRNWRLVLSDVTIEELQEQREKVIANLISPCCTTVDDSLGCACWFIGRGSGRAIDSSMQNELFDQIFENFVEYNPTYVSRHDMRIIADYTSPATILFAGSGIDEQLGGYSSHRAAWSSHGITGLLEEVSFQLRRLPTRNLGRDDRTYSHHGRDLKLPYLDYQLVSFLNQLPVGLKMNLDEPLDVGPKKLLRSLASKLGLHVTSRRIKRALQFGTRIANLESSKEKGNDTCYRLVKK